MPILTIGSTHPELEKLATQIDVALTGDDAGVTFLEQVTVGTQDRAPHLSAGGGDSTTETMMAQPQQIRQ